MGAGGAGSGSGRMRSGGNRKNYIPNNPSTIGHIFREDHGLSGTPENRNMLEKIANDPANYKGRDKDGADWYSITKPDGSQTWVRVKDGRIFNGGINNPPKPWDPETGYNRNPNRPY